MTKTTVEDCWNCDGCDRFKPKSVHTLIAGRYLCPTCLTVWEEATEYMQRACISTIEVYKDVGYKNLIDEIKKLK